MAKMGQPVAPHGAAIDAATAEYGRAGAAALELAIDLLETPAGLTGAAAGLRQLADQCSDLTARLSSRLSEK